MQSDRPPENRFAWGVAAALTAAVFVVYGQTVGHEFTNYDDDTYVYANPGVTQGLSVEGLRRLMRDPLFWWHPLTMLSHALDWQLFQDRAGLHHVTNVLLHACNSLLLFGFLWGSTRAMWRSGIVAALFAVHPLHVESVAWVSERKDVLSTCFLLLTLYAYAGYSKKGGRFRYAIVVLFFTAGLLSKSMIVTLPFVLLLLDYWPLRREAPVTPLRLVIEKAPLFALSALSSLATLFVQARLESLATHGLSLSERVGNAVVSYSEYLMSAAAPSGLGPFYPFQPRAPLIIVASLALLIAVSIRVLAVIRSRPYEAVGWFWYLGTLVPVIGIVQAGDQAMADRYTYIPLTGVFIALTWTISDSVATHPIARRAAQTATIAALLVLTVLAHRQTALWRDSVTILEHTLAVAGPGSKIQNNLGTAKYQRGDPLAAREHFATAVELAPHNWQARSNYGASLLATGEFAAAENQFRKVLEVKPDDATVLLNLAVALFQQKRIDEARRTAERALAADPTHEPARRFLEQFDRLVREIR